MSIEQLEPLFKTKGKKLSLYRFSLPFNKTINFNGHHLNRREGLWLIEHLSGDSISIGEICPLPGFSQETLEQCEQHILAQLQATKKAPFFTHSVLASVDFALFCLQQKLPWKTPPITSTDQSSLPNVPLLQGSYTEVIKRYQNLNYPELVKLKVARLSVDEDINLLLALIQQNPTIRFRLDANQQWSAEQYTRFLSHIDSHYIDYIEEPTACLRSNLNISERFEVMIGLDECLLTLAEIPQHHTIKALIIKPTLIGHPLRLHALLLHAQQQQLSVSISASFESPIALNQLQYLAQQWRRETQLSISLGLDTLQAFEKNVIELSQSTANFKNILLTQATCLWHS